MTNTLNGLPPELKQIILDFLTKKERVTMARISSLWYTQVINNADYKREKECGERDKNDIARTIAVINERIKSSKGFRLVSYSNLLCSSFSRSNIKYYDNNVVFMSYPDQYIADTKIKDGTRFLPNLVLVKRSEFNKIGTKELQFFSNYQEWWFHMEEAVIESLKKGEKTRQANESAIKTLNKLFPENKLFNQLIVIPNIMSYDIDCHASFSLALEKARITSGLFPLEDNCLIISNQLIKELEDKQIISAKYFNYPITFQVEISLLKPDEFEKGCRDFLAKQMAIANNDAKYSTGKKR